MLYTVTQNTGILYRAIEENAISVSMPYCVLHTTLHKNVFILSFTAKDPLGNAKRLGRMGNCAGKDSFDDDDDSHVRLPNGDD
jgi:hypothetical protein